MTPTQQAPPATKVEPLSPSARGENLALLFQEILTAIVRLRTDRQDVADAEAFRVQIRGALASAEHDARAAGYEDKDIRLAVYAVVAFLDESVLNSRKAIFRDWVRRPLQEELFGQHVAGETFFQYLQEILGQRDIDTTADLLEVYELCLLLGFQGRYSVLSRAELDALNGRIQDKIHRIRKNSDEMSPGWRVPAGGVTARTDRWTQGLTIGSLAGAALLLVLFVIYKVSLTGGAHTLGELANRALR